MRQLKSRSRLRACAVALLVCTASTLAPAAAAAIAGAAPRPGTLPATIPSAGAIAKLGTVASLGTASLESVATKASETGRNVAMSLIGLALAVAAIVLAFKRDFKQATAVFAVGLVCVLLASAAGESLLHDTVNTLVGA